MDYLFNYCLTTGLQGLFSGLWSAFQLSYPSHAFLICDIIEGAIVFNVILTTQVGTQPPNSFYKINIKLNKQ